MDGVGVWEVYSSVRGVELGEKQTSQRGERGVEWGIESLQLGQKGENLGKS